MDEPIDHFRSHEAASMNLQVIFTIANHLRSFAEDTCPQDVSSMLNTNGRILRERDKQALRHCRSFEWHKPMRTGTMGKAGFRPEMR